jgi:hypothetical protein
MSKIQHIKHFAPGTQLRSEFAFTETLPANVDAEAGILKGVVLCQVGEAKGHGVWLEQSFIDELALLGSAFNESGLKCRFGHPAASDDAIGSYAGLHFNIRVEGSQCLADFHLSEASNASPKYKGMKDYLLQLASENPKAFGQSIVFLPGNCYFYDVEGNKVDDDGSTPAWEAWNALPKEKRKLYATIKKLSASDCVDTGAATDGLFSEGSQYFDHLFAFQADSFLNSHPHLKKFLLNDPAKAIAFLDKQKFLLQTMSKPTKSFKDIIKAVLLSQGKKALDATGVTKDGVAITIITAGDAPAVGDSVIVDGTGEVPPAGDHEIVEGDLAGSKITTDENGIITAIVSAQEEPASPETPAADTAALSALTKTLGELSAQFKGFSEKLEGVEKSVGAHTELFSQMQKNPLTKGAFSSPAADAVIPGGSFKPTGPETFTAKVKRELDEEFKAKHGHYPNEKKAK